MLSRVPAAPKNIWMLQGPTISAAETSDRVQRRALEVPYPPLDEMGWIPLKKLFPFGGLPATIR